MSISKHLSNVNSIFIDTAPFIYYIEAHSRYGNVVKEVIDSLQQGTLSVYTSVITLAEVLPKPIQVGNELLVKKFTNVLINRPDISLLEVSIPIAELAGRIRARYSGLKTVDALQLATAIDVGAHVFLTNDKGLKQIREISIFILDDYT